MTSRPISETQTGESTTGKPAWRRVKPIDWAKIASLGAILCVFVYTSVLTEEFQVDVVSVALQYPYRAYTSYSAPGSIVVQRMVAVAPRAAGQLVELAVEAGDLVSRGQVIALIDSAPAEASLEQARARLALAVAGVEQAREDLAEDEFNLEQYRKLFEMGSASKAEYRSAETRHRKALSAVETARAAVAAETAALRSAELALDYTRIRAPFDGMVLSVDAGLGETVVPSGAGGGAGSSVATLAEVSSITAEAPVPGILLADLREGQPCVIELDTQTGARLSGEVAVIEPPSVKEGARGLLRVRIPGYDPRIRQGMAVTVRVLSRPLAQGDDLVRVMVPGSTIVSTPDGPAVYLAEEGRASFRGVRAGNRFGGWIEILEGVSAGEMLVANPPEGLEHGSRLAVRL